MKRLIFVLPVVMFLGVQAQAAQVRDCLKDVEDQIVEKLEQTSRDIVEIDYLEQIDAEEASDIATSNGLLEGKDLDAALATLKSAEQIFALYTSVGNGSATDLVTVENATCKIQEMIRVQEE